LSFRCAEKPKGNGPLNYRKRTGRPRDLDQKGVNQISSTGSGETGFYESKTSGTREIDVYTTAIPRKSEYQCFLPQGKSDIRQKTGTRKGQDSDLETQPSWGIEFGARKTQLKKLLLTRKRTRWRSRGGELCLGLPRNATRAAWQDIGEEKVMSQLGVTR